MTHLPSTDRRDDAALPANVIVYIHSTTVKGNGQADQRRLLEKSLVYAGHLARGSSLVRDHAPDMGVFVDSGSSGLSRLDERPGFAALVEWCETHPRDANADRGFVFVSSVSQLASSQEGADVAVYLWNRLRRAGWWICSFSEATYNVLRSGETVLYLRQVAVDADLWQRANDRRARLRVL